MLVTLDTRSRLLCGECFQDVKITREDVIDEMLKNVQMKETSPAESNPSWICPSCNKAFHAECNIKVTFCYGKL